MFLVFKLHTITANSNPLNIEYGSYHSPMNTTGYVQQSDASEAQQTYGAKLHLLRYDWTIKVQGRGLVIDQLCVLLSQN